MKVAPILPPIDQSLVSYQAIGPEFLALVQETLGNAGDVSDGWEADIASVLSLFAGTDQLIDSTDQSLYALGTAVDGFNSIDTTTPFVEAMSALPALDSFLESAKISTTTTFSLPPLPSLPGATPPVQPPTTCVPVGGPPPPGTIGVKPPPPTAPPPHQRPCPQGWTFVSGQCQPPPVYPSGGGPPVILPPLPAGLPPCPPGYISTGTTATDCLELGTAGPASNDFVLKLGTEILSELTAFQAQATATAWVTTFGLSLFTATLIGAAILATAAVVWGMLGGSCGEPCIVSSKIEQVYEAICTNLLSVARAGMLGGYSAAVGMFHWQNVAYTALQRLQTMAGQEGITNMYVVTNSLVAAARALPDDPSKPLILADAQALYVGGPGWYPDSIDAADKITTAWLQAIAHS